MRMRSSPVARLVAAGLLIAALTTDPMVAPPFASAAAIGPTIYPSVTPAVG